MDKKAFPKTGLVYESTGEYYYDIVKLAKAYIAAFLQQQLYVRENSIRQHLSADLPIRKETEAFLDMSVTDAADIERLKEDIRQKADASMTAGVFLPLEYLSRLFELNDFEKFVFTMVAASDLDAGFQKVFAYLNNDWEYIALTAELAKAIYFYKDNDKIWIDEMACFSADSVLSRHLLHFDEAVNKHRLKQTLWLKPQISSFIYGSYSIPDEISSFVSYYAPNEELDRILLKDMLYQRMLSYLNNAQTDRPTLFYLYGSPGIGKKLNRKNNGGSGYSQ